MSYRMLLIEFKKNSNPQKAKILRSFFKTNIGEYGEGDIFAGIPVPQSRKLAIRYRNLPINNIQKLLESKIHEKRLIALLILVDRFKKGSNEDKRKIFEFYLSNTKFINNWDLVDLSSDKIVGEYLNNNNRHILKVLARSDSIWERRIAIIATFNFIKNGEYKDTFEISEILLDDTHDLIHKAVGWMLREVGKRVSRDSEIEFLKINYDRIPRTTLRYAIEHFPEKLRKRFLNGQFYTPDSSKRRPFDKPKSNEEI